MGTTHPVFVRLRDYGEVILDAKLGSFVYIGVLGALRNPERLRAESLVIPCSYRRLNNKRMSLAILVSLSEEH